ncbi:MAG TPA: TrmH family RNA methyltransferase [Dongiaceae bacterium]|nr:TrmH family RNA methyltransferase [Dongiaceae bacterium]
MSKPKAERKIYGINACQSFYQRFPDRIIRAWLTEEAAKITFGPLMKFLAQEKRAYHLADEPELERVTDSSHHEGICLLVEELPLFTPEAWLATLPPGKPVCALALDGVANPHNLGAIMRVAAHFGVSAILTQNPQALRSGSATRTAEGGATHVMVVGTEHLVKTLHLLKKNAFSVLVTSSHEKHSVYGATPLPERLVLVLGEEQGGVSKAVLQVADSRIAIPGTGWVESLNVSVAAGVLLGEFWRQYRAEKVEGSAPAPKRSPREERPAAAKRPRAGGRFSEGKFDGKPGGGKARGGQSRGDQSRSEKPRNEKPRGEKPGEGRTSERKHSAKKTSERTFSERKPSERKPSGGKLGGKPGGSPRPRPAGAGKKMGGGNKNAGKKRS